MKATACSQTPKRHVLNYMYITGLCENINDIHMILFTSSHYRKYENGGE